MSPEHERRIRAAVFPPFIGETSEADVCALLRELDSLRGMWSQACISANIAGRNSALEEAAQLCEKSADEALDQFAGAPELEAVAMEIRALITP